MENSGMKALHKRIEELQHVPHNELLKIGSQVFDRLLEVKDSNADMQDRLWGLSELINFAKGKLATDAELPEGLDRQVIEAVAVGLNTLDERLHDADILRDREKMDDTISSGGLVIHLIPAEDGLHANYHTHGLSENWKHPDIQVVLNLEPYRGQMIISKMLERIQNGDKFGINTRYSGILPEHDILIKTFLEDGRMVLRAIVPDENGLFPNDEGCDPRYKAQMDWDLGSGL